jgi:Fe-S cluster biosynthesis and repair protein YggX/rhodanese-related sulfurtransferase
MDLKRITPAEAKELTEKEGYALLDVRSMPEFAVEHPVGAYNIPYLHKAPYGMIPNQEFAAVVEKVFPDRNAKIVTFCTMGGRSLRAAMELRNRGYQQVVDLRGGFSGERDDGGNVLVMGWRESGLPVEAGESVGRGYRELAGAGMGAPPGAPAGAGPGPAGGHDHGHGPSEHAHAGHSHAEGAACGMPAAPAVKRPNRFADPARTVMCNKFGKELPALKRKPFPTPLGERIKAEISADAWELWVEHSKMLINEYRLSPLDPRAQELLMEQCEKYFFGEGARLPEGFVPQAAGK